MKFVEIFLNIWNAENITVRETSRRILPNTSCTINLEHRFYNKFRNWVLNPCKNHNIAMNLRCVKRINEWGVCYGSIDKLFFILRYKSNLHRSDPCMIFFVIKRWRNKTEWWILIRMQIILICIIGRKISETLVHHWRKKKLCFKNAMTKKTARGKKMKMQHEVSRNWENVNCGKIITMTPKACQALIPCLWRRSQEKLKMKTEKQKERVES